jgi:phage-related protein
MLLSIVARIAVIVDEVLSNFVSLPSLTTTEAGHDLVGALTSILLYGAGLWAAMLDVFIEV